MAQSPSERSLQFVCNDNDSLLESQSPPKTITAHSPSERSLKSVCGDNSQFQSQPPQKTILTQPPSEPSPQSAFGDDFQMKTQPQPKKIMAQSPSELISLKSVCADHSQFETEPPSELSQQQSSRGDDSQVETQSPQIKIVITSPSEPSLQSQLETQPPPKTTSPQSVSLEDPQLERQLLESDWVMIEAKDLPGYYENIAEVQSPTSGDLPEEEAAVDSSRVLIDYSVPIDLTKMQRQEPSEHRRHLRKKDLCLCSIVVIVFFIALAVVSGSIYALTVFDH